jgi:hypothetical protein
MCIHIHIRAARLSVAVAVITSLLLIAPLTHAQASGPSQVCAGGACWDLGLGNAPVNLVSGGNVQDEALTVQADTQLCGGQVTSTCPFADPALNSKLAGHTPVEFAFQGVAQCADSTSAGVVSGGDCIGSHAAYIVTSRTGQGQDQEQEFLSVGEANALYEGALHLRYPQDVTYISGSSGEQLQLSPGGGASATWQIDPASQPSPSPPSFPPPVSAPPSPAPPVSAPPAAPAPTACGRPSAKSHGLRVKAWVRPAKAAGRRRTITIGYRRRSIVSGRVLTSSGRPIAGAKVCITARNQVRRARTRRIRTVRTDAHGRFSYAWRAGCSRRLWLTSDAGGGRASATVLVRARASVSLRASPTSLFNGQVMTLTGQLRGRPLPRRAIVEMQVFRGTSWETFGTANVGHHRTFSFPYRFTNTLTSFTYVFRARVPTQPGDGFAAGWSRRVPVLVSG